MNETGLLIIFCGKVGAGKSTTSKMLAAQKKQSSLVRIIGCHRFTLIKFTHSMNI
ncbi:hypothetical protein TYM08_P1436 [Marinicellulosiphila megalodicopiae]